MTATAYPADHPDRRPDNDFRSDGGKPYEASRQTDEAIGVRGNLPKLILAIPATHLQIIGYGLWISGLRPSGARPGVA